MDSFWFKGWIVRDLLKRGSTKTKITPFLRLFRLETLRIINLFIHNLVNQLNLKRYKFSSLAQNKNHNSTINKQLFKVKVINFNGILEPTKRKEQRSQNGL